MQVEYQQTAASAGGVPIDPQLEWELYDEIRSAFTTVEHRTVDELAEALGSVFTSSGHWTDQGDCRYLEPMYGDAHRPLLRLMEQEQVDSLQGAVAQHVRGLHEPLLLPSVNGPGALRGSALGVEFYFALPHSPWQRGCNENANGLLRERFPKGRPLDDVTGEEVQMAYDKLNRRPRKRPGYLTPFEVMHSTPLQLI